MMMNNINKFNKIQFKKILSNKFKHNMDNNKNIKNIIIIKQFKLKLKVISKKKMPLTMLGLVNMLIILLMSKMMKKIKFI